MVPQYSIVNPAFMNICKCKHIIATYKTDPVLRFSCVLIRSFLQLFFYGIFAAFSTQHALPQPLEGPKRKVAWSIELNKLETILRSLRGNVLPQIYRKNTNS